MSDIQRNDFRKRIHMSVSYQGTVYLTGQVGTAGKPPAEQMREILVKVETLLRDAGSNKSRILNATLILSDVADYDAVNEIWDEWVDRENAPSRSTVQAQLASKGLSVELIVIAAA